MTTRGTLRHRQRGWAGLVVLLLALLLVGWLAKDALMHYGLAGSTVARKPADAQSAPDGRGGDAGAGRPDIQRAPTPIERARAVDDIVKRGAEARAKSLQ